MSVQFYGYNFGGTSLFNFPAFILFKNLFQILVILKPYVLEETAIERALDANECVR